MLSPADVLALYNTRAKFYLPMHSMMRLVKQVYDGQAEIVLPDKDRRTTVGTPNLIRQGADQVATRVAQTVPTTTFLAETGNRPATRRAYTAARVVDGWNAADRFKQKMYQRARHFCVYGMSPVIIRWDPEVNRPVREVRNPLETYPNPETIHGTSIPLDTIFAFRRNARWLIDHGYGNQLAAVMKQSISELNRMDMEALLLEYVDADGRMLCLTGVTSEQQTSVGPYFQTPGSQTAVLLQYSPMHERYCTVGIPTRITLDYPQGAFDTMIPMYFRHGRLLALQEIGIERGIFPDTDLVSRPGEVARFLDGPHDGRSGKINIIAGGDLRDRQIQPGYMTPQMIADIERSMRITGGLPIEFSGESATNVRTGRRGDAIMSAVIDFPIGEIQDTFALALADEQRIMIELAKQYDGNNTRTVYYGVGNQMKATTYVANQVFATADHIVTYPISGMDVNQLAIGVEQRKGAGLMSAKTAMRLDPWIADPEGEHDQMQAEMMEQMVLTSLAGKIQQGAIPTAAVAQIAQAVVTDRMEIMDAIVKFVDDANAAPETTPPGAQNPQAAQAGAAALAGVPAPAQGQQNLASLFSDLRRSARGPFPPAAANG